MAAYKLLLYPAELDSSPTSLDTLVSGLSSIGLLGAPFQYRGETCHLAGGRFLQLITFLGCAPSIELEPPGDHAELEAACENARFCHIRLSQTQQRPQFRADERLPAPRCPRCRQPEQHWPDLLQAWCDAPDRNRWECTECGYQGRLFDLNFRGKGGFGKTFVEIWGIYPSEAVPGESLLSSLGELSGHAWKYMYVKD